MARERIVLKGRGRRERISATNAAFRAGGGCTDTDRNSVDFSVSAVSPRWSGTTPAPCGGGDAAPFVSSTTPAQPRDQRRVQLDHRHQLQRERDRVRHGIQPPMSDGFPAAVHAERVARHDVHADAELATAARHDVRCQSDGHSGHGYGHERSAGPDGVGLLLLVLDRESGRRGAVGRQRDAGEWDVQCAGHLADRRQLQRERDGQRDRVLGSVPRRASRRSSRRAPRRRPPSR